MIFHFCRFVVTEVNLQDVLRSYIYNITPSIYLSFSDVQVSAKIIPKGGQYFPGDEKTLGGFATYIHTGSLSAWALIFFSYTNIFFIRVACFLSLLHNLLY